MLVDSKQEIIDKVLESVYDLLRSVDTELSQVHNNKVSTMLGILTSIRNDRWDVKNAN
jgi:hypothetical protein